jgi:hypothetical protein
VYWYDALGLWESSLHSCLDGLTWSRAVFECVDRQAVTIAVLMHVVNELASIVLEHPRDGNGNSIFFEILDGVSSLGICHDVLFREQSFVVSESLLL